MPIVPVRNRHDAWAVLANENDGRANDLGRFGDAAIAPAEVFAPVGAEHASGCSCLGAPLVGCAVGRKLAGRQIAQADVVSAGRVACNGAAKSDLDVVGMRAEYEKIEHKE